ncbi:MAG: hypothetical protein QM731_05595 [Chitinophagaceae bacterium]
MIEVFKTNVKDKALANTVVNSIHSSFENYSANFDLHDCDNILRVKSSSGYVQVASLVTFLNTLGCIAEVLSDD